MVAEPPKETFALRQQPQKRSRQVQSRTQQNNSPMNLSDPMRLTRFLGWFSVGLGAAELIMPRTVARIAGTRKHNGLVRFYGLREIAAGVGIFTQSNPAPWLWARVAGDVVDLASLVGGAKRGRRLASVGSIAAVAGVTALDVLCARKFSAGAAEEESTAHAEASVLIAKSPEECYLFWRNLENLPRFIEPMRSVRALGGNSAHFVAQIPGTDTTLEWDGEITEDVPNRRISWRGSPAPALTVNGSVTFEAAPGNRGTFVRTQMDFDHPGTSFLPALRLTGKHPEQMMYKSLRRLKQLLETGEIITTEGQPAGQRSGATWLDAMAR